MSSVCICLLLFGAVSLIFAVGCAADRPSYASTQFGAFASSATFMHPRISIQDVPDVLLQAPPVTVVTPNVSSSTADVPAFLFTLLAAQEVNARGDAVGPAQFSGGGGGGGGSFALSKTTLNTTTGNLTGDLLLGSSMPGIDLELSFISVPNDLSVILPGGVLLPLFAGNVKHFVKLSGPFRWLRNDSFVQLALSITTAGPALAKVTTTAISNNRVQVALTAGQFTMHYIPLKTAWVDDEPIQAQFQVSDTRTSFDLTKLPTVIQSYLNVTPSSRFPNPVVWASFTVPAPKRSMLLDPTFAMLLDAHSSSWLSRHPAVFTAILIATAMILFAAIGAGYLLLTKGKLKRVWRQQPDDDVESLARYQTYSEQ